MNQHNLLAQAAKSLQQGNFIKAAPLLNRLQQQIPHDPRVWLYTAAYHSARNSPQDALHALSQCESFSAAQPGIDVQILQAYLQLSAWSQAQSWLKKIDRERQRFPMEHLRCLWGSGQYQQAIAGYAKLANTYPQDTAILFGYWQACSRLNQLTEATQIRKHLRGRETEHIGLTMLALRELMAENDVESAVQLLNQARNNYSQVPEALLRADYLLQNWPKQAGNHSSGLAAQKNNNQKTQAMQRSHQWLLQANPSLKLFPDSTQMLNWAMQQVDPASATNLWLEFGVYHGRSARIIAEYLDTMDAEPVLHGFDSFAGLPEAWGEHRAAGSYTTQDHIPELPDNVELHIGWFDDTLPVFLQQHPQKVAFAHIDCDIYSSTKTVLQGLKQRLMPGSILVFDELLGYPGYQQHELKALDEFAADWPGGYTVLAGGFMTQSAVIQLN